MEATTPVSLERFRFDQAVGARLKELRAALGYGGHGQARQFAAMLGIRPNHYSMVESGERPLLPAKALEVRRLFGATLDWLYGGDQSALPDHLRRALHNLITKS